MPINVSPGMSTDIWGPLFWNLIHDVCVICDLCWNEWSPQQKRKATEFFVLLKELLPCKWCRKSYKKFYTQDPPVYPFLDWVFMTHNKVNLKLHKNTTLELNKFKRRAHVYTAFGSAQQLWDLIFILTLNYNPVKKYHVYKQWFAYLRYFLPFLVRYRHYDSPAVKPLQKLYPLRSKKQLLHALATNHHRSVADVLIQYGEALAYQNSIEIQQVCGPLYHTEKK